MPWRAERDWPVEGTDWRLGGGVGGAIVLEGSGAVDVDGRGADISTFHTKRDLGRSSSGVVKSWQ
jgi:hypothetical protein